VPAAATGLALRQWPGRGLLYEKTYSKPRQNAAGASETAIHYIKFIINLAEQTQSAPYS
jgi:hypothetical protein